jgi:hypothetical protein
MGLFNSTYWVHLQYNSMTPETTVCTYVPIANILWIALICTKRTRAGICYKIARWYICYPNIPVEEHFVGSWIGNFCYILLSFAKYV